MLWKINSFNFINRIKRAYIFQLWNNFILKSYDHFDKESIIKNSVFVYLYSIRGKISTIARFTSCLRTITYSRPIYNWITFFVSEKLLLKLLSSERIWYPLTLQLLAEGKICRTISWLTECIFSFNYPQKTFNIVQI